MPECSMRPLRDIVVAKLIDAEKQSPGGIYLAGAMPGLRRATVLASGPRSEMSVGDNVFIGQSSGLVTDLDGDKVLVLTDEEIVGVERK